MIRIQNDRFENSDIPGALYAAIVIVADITARNGISGPPLVEGLLVFRINEERTLHNFKNS